MRIAALSILLAAGAALAGAANAQDFVMPPSDPVPNVVPDPYPSPGWDSWRHSHVDGLNGIPAADPFQTGVNALRDEDFARAEMVFARIVRRDRKSGEANFYLGATRMELGKWEDAKKPLEIAVAKIPEHPDPKSRLGVTYARLGDIAGANAQRARLVKMDEACKGTCELSPYIMDGIQMIDEALAQSPLSPP